MDPTSLPGLHSSVASSLASPPLMNPSTPFHDHLLIHTLLSPHGLLHSLLIINISQPLPGTLSPQQQSNHHHSCRHLEPLTSPQPSPPTLHYNLHHSQILYTAASTTATHPHSNHHAHPYPQQCLLQSLNLFALPPPPPCSCIYYLHHRLEDQELQVPSYILFRSCAIFVP